MSKFRITLFLICLTLFGTQLSKLMVESKALLCNPPPKWTVNNGTDPMRESLGNITLVTLINASYRFGLKQASSLENMLRFLKKSGLKDIHFIIVNSKDFDAKQSLKELSMKVSFSVYQESDDELVWNVLDGGKDDLFIYDRCGLLTYYIPFPLSIIHAQQPILQAALLSTYFDNPCGETCDSIDTTPTTTTDTVSANLSTETSNLINLNISSINLTFDRTLNEELGESKNTELNTSFVDLKDEEVFAFQNTDTNDLSIVAEEGSGSGSGDEPIDLVDVNQLTTESNDIKNEYNNTLNKKEDEWKILDFLRPNDNRSDKDIFDEIYNKSIIELETNTNNGKGINETIFTTQSTENFNIGNDSQTTDSSGVESTTTRTSNRFSFIKSASRAKCEAFNQSMCDEWSTDRLLRARLCCLTEVLVDSDAEGGFGCGHIERAKCNKMLPLIKCCLKDFSQLLENYFQSLPVSSRQRIPN